MTDLSESQARKALPALGARWDDACARVALRRIFDAAIVSADPYQAVAGCLPSKPKGRCVVIGAGKASVRMAAAVEDAWPDVDVSGVVVTRGDAPAKIGRIDVLQAAHPVPDERSEEAGRRIMAAVGGLTRDDLVLALMSGGGSALMVAPADPMTLNDKQAVNRALLASGATIQEMNVVRKGLSAIKGGRLAAAAQPARIVTLVISDVPGDDPAAVASGPTLPDNGRREDVLRILHRYGVSLPETAKHALSRYVAKVSPEVGHADVHLIATPSIALTAAARAARQMGLTPLVLGDAIEGEACEVGTVLAGIAKSIRSHGTPVRAPAVLLSGGETTVSITNAQAGRGGRNTELLLGLAINLASTSDVWALAGDSDGIDGTEDAAGGIVSPDTLERARLAGLDPAAFLEQHDSYSFFQALGDLVLTGPTLTNVNDIRAVLIGGAR